MLPGREVALATSEGPFEDDDGIGAHFDREALVGSKTKLQLAALKVDCHTSMLKLARKAQLHQPEIIFGTCQGAVIAAGYAMPELQERVFASRNVQQTEVGGLASAWGTRGRNHSIAAVRRCEQRDRPHSSSSELAQRSRKLDRFPAY